MKCADIQRVLPELGEHGQDGEFEAHLKSCPACSELVSDLKLISSEARQLSASDEPAPRVWVRIAAELRTEGLIREPEAAAPAPATTARRGWRAWWLVPMAAALLAGAAYVVSHRPTPQVVYQQAPAVTTPAAPASQTPAVVAQGPAVRVSPQQTAKNRTDVSEGPSPEDQQFLSEVSQRAPGMRATYESQLRSVNNYIREVQAYLDQNPDDEDARQHLMEAYQQKAMLYQMALDHVQ
ncbi:MAG: hypothetical protein LAO56_12080 [Acidobacteriia bacterium]|nr:hypothetical protein [Terriglobia bacterium]